MQLQPGALQSLLDEIRSNLDSGKGTERHGGVEDGDWREIVRVNGAGFLTGQFHKKFLEAMKFNTYERARKELIGAIGYLLIYLMHMDAQTKGPIGLD